MMKLAPGLHSHSTDAAISSESCPPEATNSCPVGRPRLPDPQHRRRAHPIPRLPSWRPPSMGCTGKPPEHRPRRRHCSMAGRQRHQSPRSTTNRRNSARNASGPVETTPRPGYRACHQPARRCEGRQATRRTHRTQSKRRQAAPVPTTRTASQRAVRARPIAHLSRQIAALRT